MKDHKQDAPGMRSTGIRMKKSEIDPKAFFKDVTPISHFFLFCCITKLVINLSISSIQSCMKYSCHTEACDPVIS